MSVWVKFVDPATPRQCSARVAGRELLVEMARVQAGDDVQAGAQPRRPKPSLGPPGVHEAGYRLIDHTQVATLGDQLSAGNATSESSDPMRHVSFVDSTGIAPLVGSYLAARLARVRFVV